MKSPTTIALSENNIRAQINELKREMNILFHHPGGHLNSVFYLNPLVSAVYIKYKRAAKSKFLFAN